MPLSRCCGGARRPDARPPPGGCTRRWRPRSRPGRPRPVAPPATTAFRGSSPAFECCSAAGLGGRLLLETAYQPLGAGAAAKPKRSLRRAAAGGFSVGSSATSRRSMSRWKRRAASSRSSAAWSASPWAAASRVRRGIGRGSITGRALRGKERSIPGIASTSVQRVFPDTIGAWSAELERRSQVGRLERGRAKSTVLALACSRAWPSYLDTPSDEVAVTGQILLTTESPTVTEPGRPVRFVTTRRNEGGP
jgi:hypothetical protein